MISSRPLQKALEHYYETHEPRFVGGYKFTYLTCATGSDFPGLTGLTVIWRSDPLIITDLRFKWYIRLWLKIKSLSWRREQQAGLKDWRPIKI